MHMRRQVALKKKVYWMDIVKSDSGLNAVSSLHNVVVYVPICAYIVIYMFI